MTSILDWMRKNEAKCTASHLHSKYEVNTAKDTLDRYLATEPENYSNIFDEEFGWDDFRMVTAMWMASN